MKNKNTIVAIAVLAALALGGYLYWGQGLGKEEQPEEEQSEVVKETQENVNNNNMELQIDTLVEGEGEAIKDGQIAVVHYTGTLEDGTVFDSSIPRGQAFSFTLGAGQVIQGWDQGVLGMKVGEKRKLIIPAELGYGDRGAGGVIPPGATLIFEVELLEIR